MLLRRRGSAKRAALITQRSQVQILPPLQVKLQVRGPFSVRGGRASDVDVNEMSTPCAPGRPRTRADRDGKDARWRAVRYSSRPAMSQPRRVMPQRPLRHARSGGGGETWRTDDNKWRTP